MVLENSCDVLSPTMFQVVFWICLLAGKLACPPANEIGESFHTQILLFFSFFRCLYYLFLSILQCCNALTVRDKHIFF